jgi:hypothetical protein
MFLLLHVAYHDLLELFLLKKLPSFVCAKMLAQGLSCHLKTKDVIMCYLVRGIAYLRNGNRWMLSNGRMMIKNEETRKRTYSNVTSS